MPKFIVTGGNKLSGSITISGAKNAALKAVVAACLTNEEVIIDNVPLISDFFVMIDIIEELGGFVRIEDHTITIKMDTYRTNKISLARAAYIRTSALFIAPLLARTGTAIIPNPGGCRIGARPIDRVIEGLTVMGVDISFTEEDGYFNATVDNAKYSKDVTYKFEKNSHTGTETLIMAAAIGNRRFVLENAAQEPEVDELIDLLNSMGAKICRIAPRTIEVIGVERLHGTRFKIYGDRNELVTFAVAAVLTEGDILVRDMNDSGLTEFLLKLDEAGGGYEVTDEGIRFYYKGAPKPTEITTNPYPGFMTDWQAPWAILMTKAVGTSVIHETVYESRFAYAEELKKMGAKIEFFNPDLDDPDSVYNFNIADDKKENFHALKITGPTNLHEAIVRISDLRAGATLVLAALVAKGQCLVLGVEHLDRGYEHFEERLKSLGAYITRVKEEFPKR